MKAQKKMTTCEPTPEKSYTSLAKTENFVPYDGILALGRKLVEELGIEDSTDTLGRWMAHHIAELISKAEKSTGDQKGAEERECFAAILALWEHRSELPNGKRPFEELEPAMRAIESLDPENDTPRYFREACPQQGWPGETPEQEQCLRLAEALDYSAKILIGCCLAEAADSARDKSRDWVKFAMAIDGEGVPEVAFHFVSKIADVNIEPDPNEEARSRLEERIKKLRAFIGIAESFATTLEKRCRTLPSSDQSRSVDS